MVRWHHQLDGHEFEQALGVGDGQGNLMCWNPWGSKELDMTERLNWTDFSPDNISTKEYTVIHWFHQEKNQSLDNKKQYISWFLLLIFITNNNRNTLLKKLKYYHNKRSIDFNILMFQIF